MHGTLAVHASVEVGDRVRLTFGDDLVAAGPVKNVAVAHVEDRVHGAAGEVGLADARLGVRATAAAAELVDPALARRAPAVELGMATKVRVRAIGLLAHRRVGNEEGRHGRRRRWGRGVSGLGYF